MIKNSLVLLIALIIFTCCKKDHHITLDINDTIRIKINDNIPNINELSKYIDSTEYIPLETNNESLIYSVSRLIFVKDTIIIFDKTGNTVFIFDSKGNFVGKVGNKGTDIDEYHEIKCMGVDEKASLIYLFDQIQFAILSYNFQGEFKGKIYYDKFYPSYFYSLNDTLYYFMNKMPYDEKKYDILCMVENNIINRYLEFEKRGSWHLRDYPFYKFNNKINYIDFFAGQILEINENALKLRYSIDFGENTLPQYILETSDNFNKFRRDYAYLKGYFLENDKYLQFSYAHNGIVNKVLYSKNDNNVVCLTNNVDNWQSRVPALFMNTFFAGNNYLVSIYLNSNCLAIKKNSNKLQDSKLKAAVKNMNVKSNPMVVIYYLK